MAEIRIGTSAFTAAGWEGSFYPEGMKPAEYLSYYAKRFDTVELDNTFCRTPSPSTVRGWYAKVPQGFLFAAKVPQVITHEKMLVDCDAELKEFLGVMVSFAKTLSASDFNNLDSCHSQPTCDSTQPCYTPSDFCWPRFLDSSARVAVSGSKI